MEAAAKFVMSHPQAQRESLSLFSFPEVGTKCFQDPKHGLSLELYLFPQSFACSR